MKETKFKQTEVGMIPSDWEVKSLRENCKLQNGYPFRSDKFSTMGNTVIRISDIDGSFVSTKNTVKYPLSEKIPDCFCVYKNDCLIAMSGATTGKVGRYDVNTKAFINQRVGKFDVVNKSFLYKDYLFHLLKSEFFQSFLKEKLAAGAQPNISSKQIEGWTTPLPPIEEQKRIAQALSDVDAVISTTEKLIAKKKALKQGTMQTLLSGKMRIQNGKWIKTTHFKQTELGPIPQEWEVRRLSNLGIFSKGCGISRDESNTGVIPAVRYGELYTTHNDYIKSFTSHISKDVASKARLLKKGDLLFTCSGETKEDIGKCVAFIGDEVAYAGGDLMILTPSININSLFYGFLLNTSIVVKQKSSRAQGDAVVHISSDSIGKILVPFPPQAEQTAIATVLSDMDSEIAAQETKLAKYRQLKTGMMQQLLTGKIRLV